MRISTPLLILAATVASPRPARASWFEMISQNWNTRGIFWDDNGDAYHDRDFNEGCRTDQIPHIDEICIDWGNTRAHIKFGGRRFCYRRDWNSWVRGDYDQGKGGMYYSQWMSTDCTWGLGGEVVDGERSQVLLGEKGGGGISQELKRRAAMPGAAGSPADVGLAMSGEGLKPRGGG